MALERESAADIINSAALQIGLVPVADPFSSTDPAFIQLRGLLTTAGRALCQMYPWEELKKAHQITTDGVASTFELPDDFLYMINQTGWEHTNRFPLLGPATPQEWAFLQGRDLVDSQIYVTFRIQQGEFTCFPAPPPSGLDINFEYISRYWCEDGATFDGKSKSDAATDIVLFEAELITSLLRLKWLQAKGFDSSAAKDDFDKIFSNYAGLDKGAAIVNMGRGGRGMPYLDPWYNLPESGYGG